MTGAVTRRDGWTDQHFLREVQYRDGGNLSARQAIYAFQQPRRNVWRWALDLAELTGDEAVVDVGCGNGRYLATLRALGHRGLVAGLDLSIGMLRGVVEEEPAQPVLLADATRLPLADSSADVVLAMHMLYHVPAPAQAVAELRRVVRPGGCALVLLNTADHLGELRALLQEAGQAAGIDAAGTRPERVRVEDGQPMLEAAFDDVELHLTTGELVVPEAEPVVAYVASMNAALTAGVARAALLDELERRLVERIRRDGAFHARTAAGCFVCR